jgi:type VI secretion system ImpM family protein
MAGLEIGIYGKLPSHADFVSVGISADLSAELYDWGQSVLYHTQGNMGEQNWLMAYLVSPVWRFVLPPSEQRDQAYLGVMIPSVDVVGRYFPLFLAYKIDAHKTRVGWLFEDADSLFGLMEQAGIKALQERWSLPQLQVHIAEASEEFELHVGQVLPNPTKWVKHDLEEVMPKLIDQIEGTLWWSFMDLADLKQPFCSFTSMPSSEDYRLLLTGSRSEY